jgi:hypothetical protein
MRLYKYRSLAKDSIDYTLNIFSSREAYFARPDSFNDPFEFMPILSFASSRKSYNKLIDDLLKRKTGLNRHKRNNYFAESFHHKSHSLQRAKNAKVLKNMIREVIGNCGVYCLSSDPLNILMWSHYADYHRGICIGFDGNEANPFFGRAQQVIYSLNYPVVNVIKGTPEKNAEKIFLTKSDQWKYEKEWRIIEHDHGSGVYCFEKSTIKELIFGVKTDPEHIDYIKNVLDQHQIFPCLYKARLNNNSFKIVLERL